MNQVTLVGHLSKDPEVRYTKTGKAVAMFTVAVNRQGQGQPRNAGEKEPADFIPVVAWTKLAEMCGNSLSKGSRVFVQGRLQVRSYETQEGQKRWVTEVIADLVAQNFESGDASKSAPASAPSGQKTASKPANAASYFGGDVFPPEEEIPF